MEKKINVYWINVYRHSPEAPVANQRRFYQKYVFLPEVVPNRLTKVVIGYRVGSICQQVIIDLDVIAATITNIQNIDRTELCLSSKRMHTKPLVELH